MAGDGSRGGVCLLSFDIEEYFHGAAFQHLQPSDWDAMPARVADNVGRIVDLLEGRKATFFFLGWVAAKHPRILRRLHEAGHEIACHGHLHRCIWHQTPEEFRADLRTAKDAVEQATGAPALGYRAPTFSVRRDTLWALDIVRELGFRYDSSIFPIRHDRYGIPHAPRRPFEVRPGLIEIPMSTIRLAGQNLPYGGGGYFRLYPYWLTRSMAALGHRQDIPLVYYGHPWEFDRAWKVRTPTLAGRIRRRLNAGESTYRNLARLLRDFEFSTFGGWVDRHGAEAMPASV